MHRIELGITEVNRAINDRDITVPIVHACPMRYIRPEDQERPVYFCPGFGNTLQSSKIASITIASMTERPVVVVPPQPAHRTLRDPRSEATDTYSFINEIAQEFIYNNYGSDSETDLITLSHGSVLGAIFISQYGPRNWDILAPMGGNLADTHTQEELDELAGIGSFKERWSKSMGLGSTQDRWDLLQSFAKASLAETVDMIIKGKLGELVLSAHGVNQEILHNLRLVKTPKSDRTSHDALPGLMSGNTPDELRLKSVLLEAFHAGATLDFRGEVATVINAGKLAVVACGSRDSLFPIETVKRTLYSHPDINPNDPSLVFADQAEDVIHPHTIRKAPLARLVDSALKERSKSLK